MLKKGKLLNLGIRVRGKNEERNPRRGVGGGRPSSQFGKNWRIQGILEGNPIRGRYDDEERLGNRDYISPCRVCIKTPCNGVGRYYA